MWSGALVTVYGYNNQRCESNQTQIHQTQAPLLDYNELNQTNPTVGQMESEPSQTWTVRLIEPNRAQALDGKFDSHNNNVSNELNNELNWLTLR